MYRLVKMTKWYATEIESIEDDAVNIQAFVDSGDTVILVDSLDMIDSFDIDEDEMEIV